MNEKFNWQEHLGFTPSPALKAMILEAVENEGISLEEAAGKYSLPKLFFDEAEAAAFQKLHPHRKYALIL